MTKERSDGARLDLASLSRKIEPVFKGLRELTARLDSPGLRELRELTARLSSLTQSLVPAASSIQAAAREWAKTESLLKRGWMPNHTIPFDVVSECGDDAARLQTSLLSYYTDNWGEVRAQLETQLSSYNIDDEAEATFREALDAHEAGLYRCVSRVLFPEFEREFRVALFDGGVGSITYKKFIKKLSGTAADLKLGDFLIAGIQDMVLFNYLTENDSRSASSEYVPTLGVGINKRNVEQARQNPIPTRHAVVHGLVTYSSRQSSLNAIFIADYVFSVMSRARPGLTGPGA